MEDKPEPKTASVFDVHLTLNGAYASSKREVTMHFHVLVFALSADAVRKKIKQLNLPGTCEVKEVRLCDENGFVHELRRQAKRENFDFKLVVVDDTVLQPSP